MNETRLTNLGNTCYQNSVLHCLIHTPGGFNEYILSGAYLDSLKFKFNEDKIYKTLIFQYHRITDNIYKSGKKNILSIHTWTHLVGIKNDVFSGFEQQDAQEFLNYIIDQFSEECGQKVLFLPKKHHNYILTLKNKILNTKADLSWEQFLKKKFSILVPMFFGLFRTQLKYDDSNYMSNTFTPFNIIQLHIPTIENPTIFNCLDLFLEKEILDKHNAIESINSYGKTTGEKQETIWKLPKYLFFQIKRFKYNDYGQVSTKDNTLVKYPIKLNMNQYIDPNSKYYQLEHKYKLWGVVLHHGFMRGGFSAGHYVAFLKNRSDGNWYLYNDDNKPEKIDNPKNLINQNAYLLMYHRID